MVVRTLLAISYPIISVENFAWIQTIRQQYDVLNFSAIDPHFTLVLGGINKAVFQLHNGLPL